MIVREWPPLGDAMPGICNACRLRWRASCASRVHCGGSVGIGLCRKHLVADISAQRLANFSFRRGVVRLVFRFLL
eukprot:6421270-Prymnesium_polylepis.1